MGFTYKSRYQVEPWGKQFTEKFGKEPDIAFFEMPMMGGGLINLIKPFTDSGMRRGTPSEAQDNVICVYADNDSLKQAMRVEDPDAAHLLLLDQNGVVRWRFAGPVSDAIFAELTKSIGTLRREA